MKRLLFIIVTAAVIILYWSPWTQLTNEQSNIKQETIILSPQIPELEAQGAVVIDQERGEVLYGKNALKNLYPASTTKILTALLALEYSSVDELVTVGQEILLVPSNGSRAGLKIGNRITVRDLIYSLLLPSGNDAAYTIAVHVGRSKAKQPNLPISEALVVFSELMNQRAGQIGAKDSHFINPDGYQASGHYSTPYDMALIARKAMENPLFRQVVGSARYAVSDIGNKDLDWENTNELLHPDSPYFLPNATGIKTGHTTPAGACLVSSASYPNQQLIAVVLHSTAKSLYPDSIRLLDFGVQSNQFRTQNVDNLRFYQEDH